MRSVDVLALDEALQRLAEMDERKSQVVGYRFVGEMNVQETAEVLNALQKAVQRVRRLASEGLFRALGEEGCHAS